MAAKMIARWRLIAALLWLTLPAALPAQPAVARPAVPPAARFQEEIDRFAENDRANPPAQETILFVGSSIFRQWTGVSSDMAPLPVLNRAFGGSRTQDQLDRFEQVVSPSAPRVIVYYCGSNDLKAGDAPEAIFARVQAFTARVRAALPHTRLIFVSSTRSPDRVEKWPLVDRYNELVRDFCRATPGLTFIDVNPVLLDATGRPRADLYREDQLHFHPPAYALFTAVIKPVLQEVWAETTADDPKDGAACRREWVHWLDKIARPVLQAGAAGELHARLPVAPGTEKRAPFARLEAVGRLLSGMAPWLESDATVPPAEAALRTEYRALARATITSLVNPASPDRVDPAAGPQILVDSAFLAEAMLRAPRELWTELPPATKERIVQLLIATRQIKPSESNWLLFSAMIESFLLQNGLAWNPQPIEHALRQHTAWYKGDGFYGDGPEFHFDYYNSIVIHPMLLEVAAVIGTRPEWATEDLPAHLLARAQRHAAVLERLISPEGSLPPVGRSLAYRCGVLHGLAQVALLEKLPAPVTPAQVRGGMTAAMRRLLEAPGTFDHTGWLTIGFAGAQPAIGEPYISTGSTYLAAAAFLPLGLPPANPFWADAPAAWTAAKVYSGADAARDQALKAK